MKFDIVTIGDAFEDVFIRPAEIKISDNRSVVSGKMMSFELGEKIPIEEIAYDIGGSACNLSVGLARFGLKTSVITSVGQDSPAVNTDNITTNEEENTNFSVVINTKDGERTIFAYHGVHNNEEYLIKKSLNAEWYFLAPIKNDSAEIEKNLIEMAEKNGSRIAWNPGSIQIKEGANKHRSMLQNTSLIFVNKEEAIKLIDLPVKPNDEEILRRLASFGPKIVVMTKGKEGAKAYDGRVFYKIDIIKDAKRVDATGAGDSFAVGFLGKLILSDYDEKANNKDLICEALKCGIINSTSVVGQIGAQKGLLTFEEIEKEFSKHTHLNAEVY
jgi:sugar/nucleoside kinase (ribokinase family)